MIPAGANSWSGPLSSDTFFVQIWYDGWMTLGWRLDSGSGGATFTLTAFSWDTFLARIGDDAVIYWDYQLGGGSGGTIFTVTSFSGETSFAPFKDDAGMAWGYQLDGGARYDREHAVEFLELIGREYWWESRGQR